MDSSSQLSLAVLISWESQGHTEEPADTEKQAGSNEKSDVVIFFNEWTPQS